MTIKGLCALGNADKAGELTVTCKDKDENGNDVFIKDFFGLSNSVTYAVVQTGTAAVSSAHYSIQWAPGTLVPSFRGAGGEPLTSGSTITPSQPATTGQASQNQKASPGIITTISPSSP